MSRRRAFGSFARHRSISARMGAGTVAAGLYNAVSQNIAIRAVADKGSMRKG